MGGKVGENPAALRAAVFSLSSKNLRGGGVQTPPPPSSARVETAVLLLLLFRPSRLMFRLGTSTASRSRVSLGGLTLVQPNTRVSRARMCIRVAGRRFYSRGPSLPTRSTKGRSLSRYTSNARNTNFYRHFPDPQCVVRRMHEGIIINDNP